MDFNEEEDYSSIITEIRGSHNTTKNGLDKNILCILAAVTTDGTENHDTISAILEQSSLTRKTVIISLTFLIFRR
jgi:hypothetical protein